MNVEVMRHFFAYHFAENRTMWDTYIIPLSQAQFMQDVDYSLGSVRNQLVHLVSVDDAWFSDLRGVELPEPLDLAQFDERNVLRAHWDKVEQTMRDYLAELRDETLHEKPLQGEDANLTVWQVLLHVVNHGTDHRAQVLRALHDLGVKTTSQDYIFYVYDNP